MTAIEHNGFKLEQWKLNDKTADEFFGDALEHEWITPIPEQEWKRANTDANGVRAAAEKFVRYMIERWPGGGVYVDLVNVRDDVPPKEYTERGTEMKTPERSIRIMYLRPGCWTWEADGGGYCGTDAGGSYPILAKWIRFGFTFA